MTSRDAQGQERVKRYGVDRYDGDKPVHMIAVDAADYDAISRELAEAKAEVDHAEREIERLIQVKEQDAIRWTVDKDRANAAESALTETVELRERVEACERDAGRYRWLREHHPISVLNNPFGIEAGRNPDDELDTAIDAQLSALAPKAGGAE